MIKTFTFLDELAELKPEHIEYMREEFIRRHDSSVREMLTANVPIEPVKPMTAEDVRRQLDEIDRQVRRSMFIPAELTPGQALLCDYLRFTDIPKVIVTGLLPTEHYATQLGEAPPSKHRSKRLWKKLRRGTRRRSRSIPLHRPKNDVYVFGNTFVMPQHVADLIHRRMG
jgi:hypothetical protein